VLNVSHGCRRDSCDVSPGVDGVAVAGQRLGGGSGVHVAGIGPSGRGRFRGVMLLHRGHGGPWAGALGSSWSHFLLIGTEKHQHTHEHAHTCRKAHATAGPCQGGSIQQANGSWVGGDMWSVFLDALTYA